MEEVRELWIRGGTAKGYELAVEIITAQANGGGMSKVEVDQIVRFLTHQAASIKREIR